MQRIAISIALLLCLTACGRGYSEGDRVGAITKFSHKGLFIKSWEGQQVMGGFVNGENGPQANVFNFTVVDDGIAAQVNAAASSGKPVKLHYIQWLAAPISMSSQYEIVRVEAVAGR